MKIERKLAVGYAIIVALIGGIAYTYLHEWRQMNRLEREVREIHRLRENVHDAYVHMLDLTMFGESVLEWKDNDTIVYRNKRLAVDSILNGFKRYYAGERIDSVRSLLAEREVQMFSISRLFEEQNSLNEKIAERIPVIAYKSTQEKPKKKGGFLGLFKKKDDSPSTTSVMLYTLNRDVVRKQGEQSRRIAETVDSLAVRNTLLNEQLKSFITELDGRVQEDLHKRETDIEQTRKKNWYVLSGLTVFIILLLTVSYIVIVRDYGRKEHVRRKLEESDHRNRKLLEMRNNIILTISHDIRGPLNTISGSAELAMETRDKKRRNRHLENIASRCRYILQLVNNLLDVYRLGNSKETPHNVPFRLSDALNRIVVPATQLVNDKGLLFEHDFSDTDVVVMGDVDRIEQIVNNLITNAVKFTEAGTVRFTAGYRDGVLNMEVSDTGIGMSEETLERIFIPFERASESADGFGLGLPITQGLVLLLDGTIQVSSEIDKGSVFSVSLPLPLTDEQVEEESALTDTVLNLPQNVLVIDDDPLQLEVTKELLERSGVSCTTCNKAEEVVKEIRGKDYDLLLTDIQMPGTDGFALLELLRKSRIGNSREIPVIAMTARGDREKETLLAAGFNGTLFKPFSSGDLLKCLSVSTANGRAEDGSRFATLLSEVTDKPAILDGLADSCRKDIADLESAGDDTGKLREVLHRMYPIWEMLGMKERLQPFREAANNPDTDAATLRRHTAETVAAIEELINEAVKERRRIADEEKDTDS